MDPNERAAFKRIDEAKLSALHELAITTMVSAFFFFKRRIAETGVPFEQMDATSIIDDFAKKVEAEQL